MSRMSRRSALLIASMLAVVAVLLGVGWFFNQSTSAPTREMPIADRRETSADVSDSSTGAQIASATIPPSEQSPVAQTASTPEDIYIDRVEWNQGTGIVVMKEGEWIPARDRNAPIIAGRPSLVRVFYALTCGFAPRKLRAELTLLNGAQRTILTDERVVVGPGDHEDLDGTFAFVLPEAVILSGTRVSVRLVETSAAPEAVTDDLFHDLEVLDAAMALSVRIVPATLGCADSPALPISERMRVELENELYNLFPVSELAVEVLPPVPIDAEPCGDPAAVIAALARMREADNISPDVLLHAIFPYAQRHLFPVGYETGFSTLENEQSALGDPRVSYSVAFQKNWRHNVAHELGHSLGRPHTFADKDYQPAAGRACGRRDTVGYGVRSGPHGDSEVFHHPAFKDMSRALFPATDGLRSHPRCGAFDGSRPTLNDFMSYEGPFWVSAYTYSRLAGVISVLSRWRHPATRARLEQFSRMFSLHAFGLREDGPLHFVWMRGHPAQILPREPSHRATVSFRDSSREPLHVFVDIKRSLGSEYAGMIISLPEGVQPSEVSRVEYSAGMARGFWENE